MKKLNEMTLKNCILFPFVAGMCVQRLAMGVSSVLLGISVAALILYVWKYWDDVVQTCKRRDIRFYVLMHMLFIVSILPSFFGTDKLGVSLREFFNLSLYHVVPFIVVMVVDWDKQTIIKMLMAFLVLEAVECFVAIYQTVTLYSGPGTRGDGFGVSGLFMPGMLSFAVPLCGMLFVNEGFDQQLRRCALITFPFFVGGVWAANSRAGMLIFLLDILILIGIYLFNGKKFWFKIGVVVGIILVCGGIFMYRGDRIRSAADFSGKNTSNYARILLWKSSLNMMKDYPITGIGLGNWKRIYKQKYKPQEIIDIGHESLAHAHSSYFQIGGQAGWPGFIGLIVFHLGVLGYSLWQWLRKKDVCCGIVFLMWLGESIFGLIEPVFVQTVQIKFIMWTTGMILVLRKTVDSEKR